MTQTAEVLLPNDVQPETAFQDRSAEPTPETPAIRPEMAKLLDLTQASGSTTTAKEINQQLDRVLRDYDELTALYAENNRRIDSELTDIRQVSGGLSSRVHQLGADLQQQSTLLTGHATTTHERINAVREEARAALAAGLADSEQRWESRLLSNNARISSELTRLDENIESLEALFRAQEQILGEQRARLDQFDLTHQLLDTATRSNKARIEAVREEAEKKQAIVETRIDGLSALQREHYAEFQDLKGLVGVLQSETKRLDAAIGDVATDLATHRDDTRDRFKWTHLAIAGLLVLTVAGFALVKWSPAFAPAGHQAALAQNQAHLGDIDSQVAALSARQTAQQDINARQQANIDQVSAKVSGLEKSLGDLRAAMRKLRTSGAGSSAVLRDGRWLLQQNPKAYTVQLVTSPSQADMARFIDRNIEQLALDPLAYSVSDSRRGERYNLFYGVFTSVAQARAAIAALPPELEVNRPWVRPVQSVQESLR